MLFFDTGKKLKRINININIEILIFVALGLPFMFILNVLELPISGRFGDEIESKTLIENVILGRNFTQQKFIFFFKVVWNTLLGN